jgi:flagellar hook-associated protein FlgK
MAKETGTLINAEPLFYDDGNRMIWESDNGDLFAWELEVQLGQEVVFGKAFTKKEDEYSLPANTEIVFNTDWVEKHGLPYFKGIKDANSKYANRGGSSRSSSRGSSRSQSRSAHSNTSHSHSQAAPKAAPKSTDVDADTIKRNALGLTLEYLNKIQEVKELTINAETIKSASDSFIKWVSSKENKAIGIHALIIAIKTIDINMTLVEFKLNISNTSDLFQWGEIYYDYLLGKTEEAPI